MTMQLQLPVAVPPSGGFEDTTGRAGRAVEWLRRNLFSSFSNTFMTLAVVVLVWMVVPPVFNWAIADATRDAENNARANCEIHRSDC